MTDPLWTPNSIRREASNLWAFAESVDVPLNANSYSDLHNWSLTENTSFWRAVWKFASGVGDLGEVDIKRDGIADSQFFPDAKLNLAENYLRRSGNEPALIYRGENVVEQSLTFSELRFAVGRVQQALRSEGVGPGDRVATLLPNAPEAVIVFWLLRVLEQFIRRPVPTSEQREYSIVLDKSSPRS